MSVFRFRNTSYVSDSLRPIATLSQGVDAPCVIAKPWRRPLKKQAAGEVPAADLNVM